MGRNDPVYSPTLTIANGANISNAADISKLSMRGGGIEIPSAWTAADVVFQVSNKDTEPTSNDATWRTLYKPTFDGSNSEVLKVTGIVTNVANVYAVPPELWMAGNYKWIRVCSRSTSNPLTNVNQGAERTLKLVTLA